MCVGKKSCAHILDKLHLWASPVCRKRAHTVSSPAVVLNCRPAVSRKVITLQRRFHSSLFMETALSGNRGCLAEHSLIKLRLTAPEVRQEICPTPLRSHRKQSAGRPESVKKYFKVQKSLAWALVCENWGCCADINTDLLQRGEEFRDCKGIFPNKIILPCCGLNNKAPNQLAALSYLKPEGNLCFYHITHQHQLFFSFLLGKEIHEKSQEGKKYILVGTNALIFPSPHLRGEWLE